MNCSPINQIGLSRLHVMGHFISTFRSNKPNDDCEGPASTPIGTYDYQPDDSPWVCAIRDTKVLDWSKGLSREDIEKQNRIQEDLPVHIYENVYLGNAASVEDISKLQRLGITRVLNMAGQYALKRSTIRAYEKLGIEYMRISARDETDYPLLERDWEKAHSFLHWRQGAAHDTEKDVHRNNNVVVHCVAGMNRSALVVAADYMITCQKPVLEVVREIRRQRGNTALSNPFFQEQLVALARISNLLGKPLGCPASFLPRRDSTESENDAKIRTTERVQGHNMQFTDT